MILTVKTNVNDTKPAASINDSGIRMSQASADSNSSSSNSHAISDDSASSSASYSPRLNDDQSQSPIENRKRSQQSQPILLIPNELPLAPPPPPPLPPPPQQQQQQQISQFQQLLKNKRIKKRYCFPTLKSFSYYYNNRYFHTHNRQQQEEQQQNLQQQQSITTKPVLKICCKYLSDTDIASLANQLSSYDKDLSYNVYHLDTLYNNVDYILFNSYASDTELVYNYNRRGNDCCNPHFLNSNYKLYINDYFNQAYEEADLDEEDEEEANVSSGPREQTDSSNECKSTPLDDEQSQCTDSDKKNQEEYYLTEASLNHINEQMLAEYQLSCEYEFKGNLNEDGDDDDDEYDIAEADDDLNCHYNNGIDDECDEDNDNDECDAEFATAIDGYERNHEFIEMSVDNENEFEEDELNSSNSALRCTNEPEESATKSSRAAMNSSSSYNIENDGLLYDDEDVDLMLIMNEMKKLQNAAAIMGAAAVATTPATAIATLGHPPGDHDEESNSESQYSQHYHHYYHFHHHHYHDPNEQQYEMLIGDDGYGGGEHANVLSASSTNEHEKSDYENANSFEDDYYDTLNGVYVYDDVIDNGNDEEHGEEHLHSSSKEVKPAHSCDPASTKTNNTSNYYDEILFESHINSPLFSSPSLSSMSSSKSRSSRSANSSNSTSSSSCSLCTSSSSSSASKSSSSSSSTSTCSTSSSSKRKAAHMSSTSSSASSKSTNTSAATTSSSSKATSLVANSLCSSNKTFADSSVNNSFEAASKQAETTQNDQHSNKKKQKKDEQTKIQQEQQQQQHVDGQADRRRHRHRHSQHNCPHNNRRHAHRKCNQATAVDATTVANSNQSSQSFYANHRNRDHLLHKLDKFKLEDDKMKEKKKSTTAIAMFGCSFNYEKLIINNSNKSNLNTEATTDNLCKHSSNEENRFDEENFDIENFVKQLNVNSLFIVTNI
jgi:hypothetical protein